jgi:elongator complex protein 3
VAILLQRVAEEIIQAALKGEIRNKDDLQKLKRRLCRKYHLSRFPSDVEILSFATESEKQQIQSVLRKKPTRTLSGVAIVAVMTKPMECPGQCLYCPTNIPTAPKAYVGEEPATLRARQHEYDPFQQVSNRLAQLQAMGHSIDKIELIVMGGTFLATTDAYQNEFIKRCLDAMNGRDASSLPEAIQWAEKSSIRPVGITIETRPDYCRAQHVDKMLESGATRVEIGVQTVYDDIYERVRRGHTVSDVISSTQIAKDAGLKVVYHIMPGLPGSTPDRDREMIHELFTQEKFQPDMLKIYPCLVLRGSPLFDLWQKGEYVPYTTEQTIELLGEALPAIPRWVRIQRMQRDIPARLIVAGPTAGNLTQLVIQYAEEKGYLIQTIRYREVGYRLRHAFQDKLPEYDPQNLVLCKAEYPASKGTEFFLSYNEVETDSLVGYLRLRFPSSDSHRPEIRNQQAALLRELHVFGLMLSIGDKPADAWQHRGVGEHLIEEAENLARAHDYRKIICTSGIGAREYYRRLGYKQEGPYMSKRLL